MAVTKFIVFLVAAVLACAESAFVDTITKKCSINDGDCQKALLQKALRDIGKSGAPELGIPALDPIVLKDVTIYLLNIVNITMVDGTAKGVKNCIINKLTISFEDGHASLELLCDSITVKGHYRVSANSPIIKSFLGGGESVSGDGNGKVKIEKLKIGFDFYFKIVKRGDDFYIHSKFDKSKYTFDVLGKLVFAADNLYIGKEESSAKIVDLINNNWRPLMNAGGKQIMDTAMQYVYDFIHKFFNNCPTKYYISDDLSEYV